mgnify:CR=1 FL=1
MNIYKIEITKPFDYTDPHGKFKVGDVGIYSAKVKEAIKQEAVLEVTTPYGTTYVKPRQLVKAGQYIYRKYLKEQAMMLYILTPDYSITKEMFEPKPLPELDKNGASKLLSAYKEMLKKKLCTH